ASTPNGTVWPPTSGTYERRRHDSFVSPNRSFARFGGNCCYRHGVDDRQRVIARPKSVEASRSFARTQGGPSRRVQEEQLTGNGQSYKPKTYSTVALRCSLSSGVLTSLFLAAVLGPDTIATYCLPPTSKVMGGAENPEPTLIFHNSSSEVSSKAATVPSNRPRKTKPPAVASVPE